MLLSCCLCTQLLSVWVEEIAVAATLHTENHNSDFNETFSLEHYSVRTTERIFLLADWKCTNSDSSITTETCGGEMRICWLCWSLLCDKDMNSLCKVTSGCQSFNTTRPSTRNKTARERGPLLSPHIYTLYYASITMATAQQLHHIPVRSDKLLLLHPSRPVYAAGWTYDAELPNHSSTQQTCSINSSSHQHLSAVCVYGKADPDSVHAHDTGPAWELLIITSTDWKSITSLYQQRLAV